MLPLELPLWGENGVSGQIMMFSQRQHGILARPAENGHLLLFHYNSSEGGKKLDGEMTLKQLANQTITEGEALFKNARFKATPEVELPACLPCLYSNSSMLRFMS